MKFTKFLSDNLDRRRGFQTELADHLEVAKSTITAWRQGATPDFASCLKLAEYFRLDPLDIFEMLEDANYISVYMRFFARGQGEEDKAESESEGPEAAVRQPLSEEDLYSDGNHARLHRDLQTLLTVETPEARAIATVIRMAARQVRIERGQFPEAEDPLPKRLASFHRTLRAEGQSQLRKDLEEKKRRLPSGDLRAQES